MLTFILLFFIGKYYYELAQDYYKHRWLFGILGIAMYYVGTFLYSVFMNLAVLEFNFSFNIYGFFRWELARIAVGIGFAYLVMVLLERKWKKEAKASADEIELIGKTRREQ